MITDYQSEEDRVINASLKALRFKADEKQAELLDSQNDMVASQVAKDILDRTGHKAVEKKEVSHHFTFEQKLQQILNPDTQIEEKIVDAEYAINGDKEINTGEED
jgi:hypothetical protein